MTENWLPALTTDNAEAGYELAIRLSRLAVKFTQPDAHIRKNLRTEYEQNAELLISLSSVVAINFQTVAAANNYWKKQE